MDETLKDSLRKLVTGQRNPESGMEIHFLNVIKGKNKPCTKEEKDWYSWWMSFSNSSTHTPNPKELRKELNQIAASEIKARSNFRDRRSTNDSPRINPNLERIQREKDAELVRSKEIGPKPVPNELSQSELLKLKTKVPSNYKVEEGIAGSREDNKKMRSQLWGEMLNRAKQKK